MKNSDVVAATRLVLELRYAGAVLAIDPSTGRGTIRERGSVPRDLLVQLAATREAVTAALVEERKRDEAVFALSMKEIEEQRGNVMSDFESGGVKQRKLDEDLAALRHEAYLLRRVCKRCGAPSNRMGANPLLCSLCDFVVNPPPRRLDFEELVAEVVG